MVKTDSAKQLYNKLNVASKLLREAKDKDERVALANYVGNLYNSIQSVSGVDLVPSKKKVFGGKREYLKFLKILDIYESQMLEHFVLKKDFHKEFFSDIVFEVENNLSEVEVREEISYSNLNDEDFYMIFFDFMNSLGLSSLFEKSIKEKRIYSFFKADNDNVSGYTLYNPTNKDFDIFVGNFDYNIGSMFTLAHEFGHVYDVISSNNDVTNYNKLFYQSFYGEIISRLFERLFISYMIKNNIFKDEVRDKLYDLEMVNYDYLLGGYILSILDDYLFLDNSYIMLSKDEIVEMIKKNFIDEDGIRDYIFRTTYFDVSEDFTYAYGDIISMFFKDIVIEDGLNNEVISSFFELRTPMFDEAFLNKFGINPSDYSKLHKKEIQFLKK